MPDVGALSVWDGTSWVLMTEPSTPAVALRSGDSFTVTFDVETIGGPSSMPKPIKWVPADHGEPDPYGEEEEPEEDRAIAELLEVLLCPNCDMELSAPACTPQHAYLADNPVEHRLLKPLLVPYLKQLRFDEGRLCSSCTFAAGHDVVIATAECNHVDARGDQVLISTVQWAALTEVIADARGALAGIEDRLKDGEDAVASLLLWHYFHRKDSGHLTTSTYWHGVAKKIIDGLTDGFEEKT